MTATDELRRMLDERGVEWWPSDERWNEDVFTHWYAGLLKWTAIEGEDGLWLNAGVAGHNSLTPEQVIAATLGAGTCHDVHEPPKGTTFWPSPHFKCSECGATYVSMEYVFFCPNCGRKVVDE